MSPFSVAVQILKAIIATGNASRGFVSLYDTLAGNGGVGAILDKLDAIQKELSHGLNRVAAAVNNNTYRDDWRIRTQQLDEIQSAYRPIVHALETLTPEHRVVFRGRDLTLVEWCETGITDSDANSGALTTLAFQLEKLENLLSTGGTTANPSLLDVWELLCSAAAENRSPGFVGQTQYTLTLSLMLQIFGMLGVIVVTHDVLRELYLKKKPDGKYRFASLRPLVQRRFGDVQTPGTVWGTFASRLDAMIASAPPDTQYGKCMTSSDNGLQVAAASPPARFTIKHGRKTVSLLCVCTTKLVAPPGSYIGGVRLRVDTADYLIKMEFPLAGEVPGATRVLYLEAVPVSIGPNLVMTPGSWQSNRRGEWKAIGTLLEVHSPPTLINAFGISRSTSARVRAYFNTTYAKPPVITKVDQYAVVTGLWLRPCCGGTRLGLWLRYSTLNLSNPAEPLLTNPIWVEPSLGSGSTSLTVSTHGIGAADQRPAGTTDFFPASNATFIASHPPIDDKACLGVALQNALPLHRLTWLQPAAVFGPDGSD